MYIANEKDSPERLSPRKEVDSFSLRTRQHQTQSLDISMPQLPSKYMNFFAEQAKVPENNDFVTVEALKREMVRSSGEFSKRLQIKQDELNVKIAEIFELKAEIKSFKQCLMWIIAESAAINTSKDSRYENSSTNENTAFDQARELFFFQSISQMKNLFSEEEQKILQNKAVMLDEKFEMSTDEKERNLRQLKQLVDSERSRNQELSNKLSEVSNELESKEDMLKDLRSQLAEEKFKNKKLSKILELLGFSIYESETLATNFVDNSRLKDIDKIIAKDEVHSEFSSAFGDTHQELQQEEGNLELTLKQSASISRGVVSEALKETNLEDNPGDSRFKELREQDLSPLKLGTNIELEVDFTMQTTHSRLENQLSLIKIERGDTNEQAMPQMPEQLVDNENETLAVQPTINNLKAPTLEKGSQLAEYEEQIMNLQGQTEALRKRLTTLADKKQHLEAKLEEMQQSEKLKDEELENLRTTNQSLKQELDEMNPYIQVTQEYYDKLLAEFQKQEDEIKSLVEAYDNVLKGIIAELCEQEADSIEVYWTRNPSKAQGAIIKAMKELGLKTLREQGYESVDELLEVIEELQSNLEKSNKETNDLQNQLVESKKEYFSVKEKLDETLAQFEKVIEEEQSLVAKIEALEEELAETQADHEAQVELLEEEAASLKKKLKDTKETKETKEIEGEIEQMKADFENEMKGYIASIQHLETAKSLADMAFETLKKENQELIEEKNKLIQGNGLEKQDLESRAKQLLNSNQELVQIVSQLKAELLEKNAGYDKLTLQVTSLEEKVTLQTEKINSQQDELDSKHKRFIEYQEEIAQLEQNLRESKEKNKNLLTEIDELVMQNSLSKRTRETENEEAKRLEEQVQQKEKEIASQKEILEQQRMRIQELETEMTSAKLQIIDQQATLMEHIKSLKSDLLGEAQLTVKVEVLTQQVSTLKSKISEQAQQVEELTNKYSLKQEECQDLSLKLAQAESEGKISRQQLEAQINELIESKSEQETKLRTLTQEITLKQDEIEKLREDAVVNKEKVIALNERVKNQQEELEMRQNRVRQLQDEMEKLEEKLKETQTESVTISFQAKDASSKLARYKALFETEKKRTDDLNQELTHKFEEIGALQNAIQSKDQAYAESQKQNFSLKLQAMEEKGRLSQDINRLEASETSLKSEINKLQEELKTLTQLNKEQSGYISELKQKSSEMQEETQSYRLKMNTIEAESRLQKQQLEAQMKEAVERAAEIENYSQKLKAEIEAKKNEIESISQENSTLKEKIACMNERAINQQEEINLLLQRIDKQKLEITNSEQEIRALKTKNNELMLELEEKTFKFENEKRKGEINALELESLKQKLGEGTIECDKLKGLVAAKDTKINEIEKSVVSLKQDYQQENDILCKEIENLKAQLFSQATSTNESTQNELIQLTKLNHEQAALIKGLTQERDQYLKTSQEAAQELETLKTESNKQIHQFETQLEHLNTHCKEIGKKLAQAQSELAMKSDEHNKKFQEVVILQEKVSSLSTSVIDQQDELGKKQMQISKLQTENSELEEKFKELINRNMELSLQVSELTSKYEAQKKVAESCKNAVETTQSEDSKKKSELESLNIQKEQTIKELEEELRKIQQQFSHSKSSSEDELKNLRAQLQVETEINSRKTLELEEAKQINFSQHEKLKNVEQNNELLLKENRELQLKLDMAESANKLRVQQLEGLLQEASVLAERQLSVVKEKLLQREGELEMSNQDRASLKEKVSALTEKSNNQQEELTAQRQRIEEYQKEIVQLETGLRESREINLKLTTQVEEFSSLSQKSKRLFDDCQGDLSRLQQENNAQKAQVESLSDLIRDKDAQIKALEDACSALKLEQAQQIVNLSEEMKKVKESILSETLKLAEKEGALAMQQREATDQKNDKLNEKYQELQAEAQELKLKLKAAQTMNEVQQQQFESQMKHLVELKNTIEEQLKFVNSELASRESAIEKLTQETSSNKEALNQAQTRIQDLEKELSSTKLQVLEQQSNLVDQIKSLKSDLLSEVQLTAKLESLNQQINTIQTKNAEQAQQLEELSKNHLLKQQQCQELSLNFAQMEAENKIHIHQLEAQIKELTNSKADQEIKISNLTQEIMLKQKEIERLSEEAAINREKALALNERVNNQQEELGTRQERIAQLQATIAKLEAELNEAKKENIEMTFQSKDASSKLGRYKGLFEAEKKRNEELQKELTEKNEEISHKNEMLNNRDQKIAELQKQNVTMKLSTMQEKGQATQEINRLKASETALNEVVDRAQEEIKSLRALNKDQAQQISALTQKSSALQLEAQSSKLKLNALDSENRLLKQQLETLAKETADKKSEMEQMTQENVALKEKIVYLNEKTNNQQAELGLCQQKVEEQRRKLEILEEAKEPKNNTENVKQVTQEEDTQNGEFEKQMIALKAQLEAEKAKLVDEVQTLNNKLSVELELNTKHTGIIESLTKASQQQSSQLEASNSRIMELSKENEDLTKKASTLESEHQMQKASLELKAKQAEDSKLQLEEQLTMVKSQLAAKITEHDDLALQHTTLKEKIAFLTEKVNNQQEELNVRQQRLVEYRGEVVRLEQSLRECKENNTNLSLQVNELAIENEAVKKSLAIEREEMSHIERLVKQKNEELLSQTTLLAEHRVKIDELEKLYSSGKTEAIEKHSSLSEEIRKLTNDISIEIDKNNRLSRTNQDNENKITELQKTLDDLRKKLLEIEHQTAIRETQVQIQTNLHSEELAKLNAEIQSKEETLKKLETKLKETEEHLETTQRSFLELRFSNKQPTKAKNNPKLHRSIFSKRNSIDSQQNNSEKEAESTPTKDKDVAAAEYNYSYKYALLNNGEKIAYIEDGPKDSKYALIALHTNATTSYVYLDFMARMKDFIRVIAIDMRGHGRSSYLNPVTKIDDLSQDLHLFITDLGLKSVSLIGWSLGGGVGLKYSMEHPEMVNKLILQASVGLKGWSTEDETITVEDLLENPGIEMFLEQVADNNIEFIEETYQPFKQLLGQEKFVEFCEQVLKEKALQDSYYLIGGMDLSDSIAKLEAKVLILHGINDEVCPVKIAKETARVLGDKALLDVWDGVGHMMLAEAPARVASTVKKFLLENKI